MASRSPTNDRRRIRRSRLYLRPRVELQPVRRETQLNRADTMATYLRRSEQSVLGSLRSPTDGGRRLCGRRRGILQSDTTLEFNRIMEQKNQIVRGLRKEKYADVLKSLPSAKLFRGNARFVSRTRVKVDGINIEGKKFVIATGSSPRIPSIPGIENVDYLTNVEALSLKNKPASMVVLGGRALGLEFAQMYSHMGIRVTLLQRSDRIIPEEEPAVSDALCQYLEEEGIKIKTGVRIKRISQNQGEKVVVATINGREFEARGEELLLATGRAPNTDQLGLETLQVALRKDGAVKVDREMHTTAPHVWAAGDVIGEPMLETIAAKEG